MTKYFHKSISVANSLLKMSDTSPNKLKIDRCDVDNIVKRKDFWSQYCEPLTEGDDHVLVMRRSFSTEKLLSEGGWIQDDTTLHVKVSLSHIIVM